jgi:heterogeneous nuclear rnp K-like protein 2
MSSDEHIASPHDASLDNVAESMGRLNPEDAPPRTDDEYAVAQLTLRAIVSSKEAGVIIGKAGLNVAELRDKTGVRAGVSKVVPGVHDRVLTVLGALDAVAAAYGHVADGLLKGVPQMGMGGAVANPNTHRTSPSTLRLLNIL